MLNVVVRSLCVILLGVLMVVMREAFMPLIVQFIGAAFMLSGAISLFNIYVIYKRGLAKAFDLVVLAFVGIAGVGLGAWLLLPAFCAYFGLTAAENVNFLNWRFTSIYNKR